MRNIAFVLTLSIVAPFNIKAALMRSRHLIVVLTPAVFAASERQGDWVAREGSPNSRSGL